MKDNIYKKMHKVFIPSEKNNYLPHILKPKNLFILAVILVAVKFLLFSWFFYFPKTSDFAVVTTERLIELAQQERIANNLSELKINDKLTQAALEKAQDMLKNNYFAHTSPSGITPWYWFEKAGYNYVAAGENLAKDFTDSDYLNTAWMNSPSHRANILNEKYTEIGIAVLEGEINGRKTIVAVQLFGKPAAKKPVVTPVSAETTPAPSNVGIAPQPQTNQPAQELAQQVPQNTFQETVKPSANQVVLNEVTQKTEPIAKKIYFIIAAGISLVLLLTVFINIRVQYPGAILGSIIFILLVAGIALFNVHAFLNRNIDVPMDGAMVDNTLQIK